MTPGNPHTPEGRARDRIDELLAESGWVVQWPDEMNLGAGLGVAVCEFQTATGPAGSSPGAETGDLEARQEDPQAGEGEVARDGEISILDAR